MGAEPGRAAGVVVAGRYRIVRPLKAGGMGAVHEVVDLTTDRRRALKLLSAAAALDADLVARFRREATVTGRVESEHVVEVFDAGVDRDGAAFLVMELLRGEDLGARLHRLGPLSPADVIGYLSQAALGLDRTHAERIVHRDLKPDNLFVCERDDGSPCVKILDFGIAKALADVSGSVGTTRNLGTPLYMSPEQLRGDAGVDPACDLYALAHVAYTLLSGSAYFTDELRRAPNLFAFLAKVAAGPSESPSARAARVGVSLPASFDAWFARATACDPGDRFDGALDEVHQLAVALGMPTPAPTERPHPAERAPGHVAPGDAIGEADPRRLARRGESSEFGSRRRELASAELGWLERGREPSPTAIAPAPRANPLGPRPKMLAAVAAMGLAIVVATGVRRLPDGSAPAAAPTRSVTEHPFAAGVSSAEATHTTTVAAVGSALTVPAASIVASAPLARPPRLPAVSPVSQRPMPSSVPSAAPPGASRPTHDPLDEF